MGMKLADERIQRDMLDLTRDLVTLFAAKYPRFLNAFQDLDDDATIEFLIELCDVFDMYGELTEEIAALYKEHRRRTGSLEDREWPEN